MGDAPPLVYKVFTNAQWSAFETDGVFAGSADDIRDGFIHLSYQEQVSVTLSRHFSGQHGLVVASMSVRALGGALRPEASSNGKVYPHLYGPLSKTQVVTSCSSADWLSTDWLSAAP